MWCYGQSKFRIRVRIRVRVGFGLPTTVHNTPHVECVTEIIRRNMFKWGYGYG